jgi:hypothetical protein
MKKKMNEPWVFTDLHGAAEPQPTHIGIGIGIAIRYRSLKGDPGD